MKYPIYLSLLCISLALTACGGDDDDNGGGGGSSPAQANSNRNVSASQTEISRLEFPKVKGGNSFVVIHKVNNAPDPDGVNYSIEWDKDKKAQRWSCYQMNKGYAGNATVEAQCKVINENYVDNVIVATYRLLADNAQKLYQSIVNIKK